MSYKGGTLRSKHFWRSKAALKPGVQPGFLDVGWQVAGERKGDTERVWRERTRKGKGNRLVFGVGLSVVFRFLS